MKSLYLGLICLLFISSCKTEKKNDSSIDEEKTPLTVAEKIAGAHGIQYWYNVSEIEFTFKVDRDTIKGNGRSWVWKPKTQDVKMMTSKDTIAYNRAEVDSTSLQADRAFINDKFWLLFPFQLVWDENASISKPTKAMAPISQKEMNTITLLYPNEGGYTPGDAYDIFYNDDHIIQEWTFRQGNADQPSLSNTFENYQEFNGLKIAIDHKKDAGKWNLNFANVKVTLE